MHNIDREVVSEKTRPMLSHINVGTGIELNCQRACRNYKEYRWL